MAGGVVDGENNRQFAGSYSIRELGINLINPLHQTRCDPGIQHLRGLAVHRHRYWELALRQGGNGEYSAACRVQRYDVLSNRNCGKNPGADGVTLRVTGVNSQAGR